jgi:hypothetical protein
MHDGALVYFNGGKKELALSALDADLLRIFSDCHPVHFCLGIRRDPGKWDAATWDHEACRKATLLHINLT